MTISPSLMRWWTVSVKPNPPMPSDTSLPRMLSYESRNGELAHHTAAMAAMSSTTPEAASMSMNDWIGRMKRRGM